MFERLNTSVHHFYTWAARIDGHTFSDRQRHLPRHAENGGVAAAAAGSPTVAGGGDDFAVLHPNRIYRFLTRTKIPEKNLFLEGPRRSCRFTVLTGRRPVSVLSATTAFVRRLCWSVP